MNKIYETHNTVVYRGIDNETIYRLEKTLLKGDTMFYLYATVEEYNSMVYKFPQSYWLALHEIYDEISDKYIIDRHIKMDRPVENEWLSIAGPIRGIIDGK